MSPSFSFLVYLVSVRLTVFCSQTSEKIYYNLNSSFYGVCFRRLNATHQVGCSSAINGNVGTLHYIDSKQAFDWLITDASHPPYITLLSADMFNKSLIDELKISKKVNGVLIMNTNETVQQAFSPDSTCPNDNTGMYANHPEYSGCQKVIWNGLANQMLFDDYPFPIVILSEGINFTFIINDCFRKYNEPLNIANQYPLCAVQINSEMFAAKDSPTCYRRSQRTTNLNPEHYCDKLRGFNVLSTIPKVDFSQLDNNDTTIIVASRMDSFSMFDNYSPGVDSTTLSFITLHSVAAALRPVLDELRRSRQQLLFVLFDGEAFDYIGSSRLVYDMEQRLSNVTLRNIGAFIEIGQIAPHNDESQVYLHTDPLTSNDSNVQHQLVQLIDDLKMFADEQKLKLTKVEDELPLPPSSVQSFLKKKKLPAVVLTNHHRQFINRYYNSIFDTAMASGLDYLTNNDSYDTLSPVSQHIHQVATVVARTVYKWMYPNGTRTEEISPDEFTVPNLIYCFIKSSQCDLFNSTTDIKHQKVFATDNQAFHRRYVSVVTNLDVVKYTHLNLLSWALGERLVLNESECIRRSKDDSEMYYSFVRNNGSSVCVWSASGYTIASSPAFTIEGYDWESGVYSSWTESTWSSFRIRVFLQPSLVQQATELTTGLLIFVGSLSLAYFLNRRGNLLFSSSRTAVTSN